MNIHLISRNLIDNSRVLVHLSVFTCVHNSYNVSIALAERIKANAARTLANSIGKRLTLGTTHQLVGFCFTQIQLNCYKLSNSLNQRKKGLYSKLQQYASVILRNQPYTFHIKFNWFSWFALSNFSDLSFALSLFLLFFPLFYFAFLC